MLHVASMLKDYDLGCVKFALVGSSSLGKDTIAKACALLPNCNLCQGYGLTEATCAICVTPRDDFMLGSCGALFPGNQARLLDSSGNDVEDFDMPGELIVRGPSVVPGYLDNEVAMRESLTGDGWLRTGDLVEMRKSPKGNSHIFIIDRIKELIKVHVSLPPHLLLCCCCCHNIPRDITRHIHAHVLFTGTDGLEKTYIEHASCPSGD